ncbi:MAG: hypothetical protein WB493_07970 [Anaeromyxobacteraceae bacterium]
MTLPLTALALLLWSAPAPPPAAAVATPPSGDPWAPLRFLSGAWKAEGGGGKPGAVVGGGFTFAIELDGRVAVRRGSSELAPAPGEAARKVREDLTVIYPKGKGLTALYWDDEGHVIRYAVRTEAGIVIFESEPGPGPRFRLTYARRGPDLVEIAFSIAPPGKPFETHVAGLVRREPGG